MKKGTRIILQILMALAALAVGVLIFNRLASTRQAPQREQRGEIVTPVRVTTVLQREARVVVRASGTVAPARQVDVRPQVAGQIVEMNDALQPGGFFRQGDAMLRIDPRDYEYAAAQREAEVERARLEVAQEEGRQAIAEREWALLGEDVAADERGRELALRKPQLRSVRAGLASAQSSLAQAQLNLERTVVKAPFNALIRRENVDLGQLINAQTSVATIAGTDRYWVRAAIPLNDVALIERMSDDPAQASKARVVYEAGGRRVVKQGFALRLLGDLDPAGRMARVLIAIDDPLGLNADEAELPLLLDAFVQVEIEGRALHDVFALPPESVREGDRVWVMNQADRLEIRNIEAVRREDGRVLARGGLEDGDRVVVSRIATVAPGMKLRDIAAGETRPQDASSAKERARE